MEKIKPKKLQKGNTIGIIGISGRIKEYEKIRNAKLFFENNGYNVVISDSCKYSHRYMAGRNDRECIDTIHSFFQDKNIDAIVCARGGYGTLRLINDIDWNVIRNNPKIFAGYSDITVLLNMIYKKTGLVTFHSAMPNGDFSTVIENYTKDSFFDVLSGEKKAIKADGGITFKDGVSNGILWGGNLATLTSLCGIDFIPDENIILFIEDLNEPVYKIDKMLTQLFNIEKLKNNIKGIVIGDFLDIEDQNSLNEVFNEFSYKLDIPMRSGFKITHLKIKDTIPFGVYSEFDSGLGEIKIIEKYVI